MENAAAIQYKKMTETPVSVLISKLTVPTVISMLVTSIYNMADTAFVGKLGTSASGAVGIVFGFMAILQAVGFLFGQGSGNYVGRKLGARNVKAASEYASTGFFSAFALSILIEIFCFIFLHKFIYALGSSDTIYPYAKDYIKWILIAAPFMVSSFTLNVILRYEGKAFFSMLGLGTGAVLNIACDPIFMFVFNFGVAGAGISTAFSQIVSFVILLCPFFKGKTQSRLSFRYVRLSLKIFLNIFLTGLPSLLRNALGCISTMMLNYLAAPYGDAAVAGMSIASRIAMFILSISIGIGQGFQPVCSFNYGAKKYSRVRKAYFFTVVFATACLALLCTICLIFNLDFVKLFRDDPEVIAIASRSLRLQCYVLYIQPLCVITEFLMQTTGQKFIAAIHSSFRAGVFFIPSLVILWHFRGLSGIEEAQPVAYLITSLVDIPFIFIALNHVALDKQLEHQKD